MTKLFIDMDGVIADYLESAMEFIEYRYKRDLHLEKNDIKEYLVPMNYGFDINTSIKINDTMHSHYGFWREMAPVEGSISAIKRLENSGKYKVYIVTSPIYNLNCIPEKIEWLKLHLPFIGEERYAFIKDKSILGNGILIDDNMDNIRGYSGRKILLKAPYNMQNILEYLSYGIKDIEIASDWKGILKVLLGEKGDVSRT